MVTFNPRTGELFDEDDLLQNDEALLYLVDYFQLIPGSENQLTLHSFRKMFDLYPSLTQLNPWTEEFLYQARQVKPRLRLVDASDETQGQTKSSGIAYEFLDLRKDRVATKSELTRVEGEFKLADDQQPPQGSVSIAPIRGRVFTLEEKFIDKPSFEIQEYTALSGVLNETMYGLSMDRLPELMHLPIKIGNATDIFIEEFANETRDKPDFIKEQRICQEANTPEIPLVDVIMAVLEGINLDDEEEYELERQYFETAMEEMKIEIPKAWAENFKAEFPDVIDQLEEVEDSPTETV
jgi:hypothetical protein